jgi:hypothetical protein
MPRTPRVEYGNPVDPVMARGNRREAIDLDDADRDLFRETFAEAKSQKLDCDEDLRDLEPVRKLVGGPPGRWERSD